MFPVPGFTVQAIQLKSEGALYHRPISPGKIRYFETSLG